MAEKVTADIGFEKQIWDAACVLRGKLSVFKKHINVKLKFFLQRLKFYRHAIP